MRDIEKHNPQLAGIVRREGTRDVYRRIEFYDLEAIISAPTARPPIGPGQRPGNCAFGAADHRPKRRLFRTNGAATHQPRATPWELAQHSRHQP